MNETERIEFMEFAARQLRADMLDRGWESLLDLLEIFFSDHNNGDDEIK